MRKQIGVLLLSFVLATPAWGYEYIIFKRVTEDLGIETLPFKFTVWHIDALSAIKMSIDGKAALIEDPGERIKFMESEINRLDKASLSALLLMGYSGTEKMKRYGLTKTPAAVLLDDKGNVVERWNGFEHGTELLMEKAR